MSPCFGIMEEDIDPPWPAPMSPVEAAKTLHEFEERIRLEREGRDLPPEPGDEDPGCPVCQSTNGFTRIQGEWFACRGCGEALSAGEIGK